MVEHISPDETLDCRGMSCPMPLLKTKKAKKSGHEYLGEKEDEGFIRFYLKLK